MDISKIMLELTLEEKASLCSGKDFWTAKEVDRLGIPSIMLTDGPHGLRKQAGETDHLGINSSIKATCFPTAVTTGSSWDVPAMYKMGKAIAEECLKENVGVILGPGINIKRSPICGRNFEYISEDPFLLGEMSASLINGVQSKGVGTSLKHFAVNNAESYRMTIDCMVDERAYREIYLAGFETAVKNASPYTVMCSYNKINGTFASENYTLLTKILRDEWGFEGLVVTDWGAINERVEALKAGLDLEMPASYGMNDKKIVDAVNNGELDIEVLDKTVKRILQLIEKCSENTAKKSLSLEENYKLAAEIAGKSYVLLKNDNILPLCKKDKVAVIGAFAKNPRYQGAGSSIINPTKLDNLCDVLAERAIDFSYAAGYDLLDMGVQANLIDEACEMAKTSDKVVIMAGLPSQFESEGFDRSHMKMPDSHTELIKRVCAVSSNVIVILSGGSPVEMPWLGDVKAVLNTYLGGQAGAVATADIIFGDVSPSGKLAETFPICLEDNPSYNYFTQDTQRIEYRESIFVGYRYYDTAGKPVLFPFGFGLSYTKFEYSSLKVKQIDDHNFEVKFKIKNIGDCFGGEVAQLYIHHENPTVFKANKELKGFDKVYLEAGEENEITINLNKRSFAYYNTQKKDWCVESGEYSILIGASSEDIRLCSKMTVKGEEGGISLRKVAPTYYNLMNESFKVSDEEFEEVYGSSIKKDTTPKPFHINSNLKEVSVTPTGKALYTSVSEKMTAQFGNMGENDPMYLMVKAMIDEMPLRTLVMMGQGQITYDILNMQIAQMNKERPC